MRSTLVILTLNEIESLRAIYEKIPLDNVDECIAVDGGSTDGTVEFLKERGIRVLPQELKGRGEAFRIAARVATGDALVFFSPDGNEDPNDIPRLAALLSQGYDMAIASRFLKGSRNDEDGKLFPARKWANQAFTKAVQILWGAKITDTINGFRAIRKDAFERLKADAQGFVIEFQMSIRAAKLGYKVAEIATIEGDRIGGRSTASSFSTGWKALRMLYREMRTGKKFARESYDQEVIAERR